MKNLAKCSVFFQGPDNFIFELPLKKNFFLQEEAESNRDWADKNLVLSDIERYYEQLMGELENRESHFSSVQDRGKHFLPKVTQKSLNFSKRTYSMFF